MAYAVGESLRDYAFLYELGFDEQAIAEWRLTAERQNISLHDALRYDGRLDDMAYVRALGRTLRVAVIEPAHVPAVRLAEGSGLARPHMAVAARRDGSTLYILDGLSRSPGEIRRHIDTLGPAVEVALVAPSALRVALLASAADALSTGAIEQVTRIDPAFSAARRMWLWQLVGLATAVGLAAGAVVMSPVIAVDAVSIVLAAIFFLVVILRLAALGICLAVPLQAVTPVRTPVSTLPVYSVLVPLFREARIVPDLVRALKRLNYPRSRLDVKLILEAVDIETRAAVESLSLGPEFETIVVPDAMPRTKPKALNYAMNFVRGDYLTIFDAEDIPEPDQLLRALAVFRSGDDRIGAVQARLAIDNAGDGVLAGQFTLEYMALFDGLLPALDWLRLPIPLGGTSTHFPTEVVQRAGGWDPHNVTEDADLGMRLARMGYICRTIPSRTYEEAPFRIGMWVRQRTRWIKGWMQTLLVHTRQPVRLVREMGLIGTIAFLTLLGGTILSALVHPISLGVVAWQAVQGGLMRLPGTLAGDALVAVSAGNLMLGYGGALLMIVVSAVRRRAWRLLPWTLLVPLYWLLISVAAYRALFQLMTDPHKWEKTEHGLSRRRKSPAFGGK
ncbi:MAG: glycosyltransferase family 2 protein [Hyphomicrobiaceae bacterium]